MKKLFGTLTNQHSETPPFTIRYEGEEKPEKLLDLEGREVYELFAAIDVADLSSNGLRYEVTNGILGQSTIEPEEVW